MLARKFHLAVLLMCIPLHTCLASDTGMDRATLRGLTSLKIVIDQPGNEMEQEGYDRGQLQSIMEQKLRDAGIKIDNDAVEFLGLSLTSARAGRRSPVSLMMNLGLYQLVTLNRDKVTKTVAETWSAQRVLSVPPKALGQAVDDVVGELLDQFVKAYQSVNSK
ncbi:MAG TPA: hypothetical protein VJN43_06075 [Bryobacteraceae bacterium]|nr:hypothetical protein [Bryobacteraceae bacterium]